MTSAPLRIIVADDEPLARERLRRLLRAVKGFELVGEADDGPAAVSLIREKQPHIALLDVQMLGMSGFEVLSQLGDQPLPAVVFITAFPEHAVRAFESAAVDYLLKPFSKDRLQQALHRARLRCMSAPETILPKPAAKESADGGRITLKCGIRRVVFTFESILYATAANTSCEVFTAAASWKISESLSAIERRLPKDRFVRISRFALVNLSHVIALEPKSHGDQYLVLRNNKHLTVARTRRLKVLDSLKQGC